jgi:glycine/D-amino acid oxidase-like deaminating enzyme
LSGPLRFTDVREQGGQADVVVVGAGVVGLVTAVRLVEADAAVRVVVLESRTVAAGASGRAGAIDIPYAQSALHRELVEESLSWYGRSPEAAAHRQPVTLTWLADDAEERELRSHLVRPPLAAPPARVERLPGGATRAWTGEAFSVSVPELCQALRRRLEATGRGRVVEGAEVVDVADSPRGVRVSTAQGQRLTAGHAVLCVGPWAVAGPAPLARWAGEQGLRAKRVFGLRVDLGRSGWERQAVGWPGGGIFLLPHPVTGTHVMSVRHDEWDVDLDHPGTAPPTVLERAAAFLDSTMGAGGWRVVEDRAFADTYTPQFQPVVTPCPGMGDHTIVITGTHGSGVRLAPGLAHHAVRFVLEGALRQ